MVRKPIQVDEKTNEIIRREAIRQSSKPNTIVSMGSVVAQFAQKLNKKYKFLESK